MKATKKNLRVLTHLEERMCESGERIGGHPALTTHDLQPRERYHADRLVRHGLLKKTRSCAPWHGPRPVTLYYVDGDCTAKPLSCRESQERQG